MLHACRGALCCMRAVGHYAACVLWRTMLRACRGVLHRGTPCACVSWCAASWRAVCVRVVVCCMVACPGVLYGGYGGLLRLPLHAVLHEAHEEDPGGQGHGMHVYCIVACHGVRAVLPAVSMCACSCCSVACCIYVCVLVPCCVRAYSCRAVCVCARAVLHAVCVCARAALHAVCVCLAAPEPLVLVPVRTRTSRSTARLRQRSPFSSVPMPEPPVLESARCRPTLPWNPHAARTARSRARPPQNRPF
jgi:hypothetical protein